MKNFSWLVVGLFFTFLLSGCIGEEYDFTPPIVTLSYSQIQLKEANIDWQSDKQYKKETKDILSLARKQKQVSVNSGQKDYIEFDSQDFKVEEISMWIWREDEKGKLELDKNRNFSFPNEKGEYLIEVDLLTDSGSAEYVGNIVIK